MAELIRVRPVRSADGRQLPGHWRTACGYVITPCRLRKTGLTLRRDTDRAPFAYLDTEEEVARFIQVDRDQRGKEAL